MLCPKIEWMTFKSVKDEFLYEKRNLISLNKEISAMPPHFKEELTFEYIVEIMKYQIRKSNTLTYFITPEMLHMANKTDDEVDWDRSCVTSGGLSIEYPTAILFNFKTDSTCSGYDIFSFLLHYMPFDSKYIRSIRNIDKYSTMYRLIVDMGKRFNDYFWGISAMSECDKSGKTYLSHFNIGSDYKNRIDGMYKLYGIKGKVYDLEYMKIVIELAGKLLLIINENPLKYVSEGYPVDYRATGKSSSPKSISTISPRTYGSKTLMHNRKAYMRTLTSKRYEKGGPVPRDIYVKATSVKYKTTAETINNPIT